MEESQCGEFAMWGSCSVGEFWCGGVAVLGTCSVGELRCGRVAVWGVVVRGSRVCVVGGGWWCKVIIVSNPTRLRLGYG